MRVLYRSVYCLWYSGVRLGLLASCFITNCESYDTSSHILAINTEQKTFSEFNVILIPGQLMHSNKIYRDVSDLIHTFPNQRLIKMNLKKGKNMKISDNFFDVKYFIFCHVFTKNHGKFKRRRETLTKKLQAFYFFFVSGEKQFLEKAHRVEKVSFSIIKNMLIRMFYRMKIKCWP